MARKYLPAGFAIVVDAFIVAAVSAVLAIIYWLATGASGEFLRLVADLLFVEGGIILTFGALVELFKLKGTKELHRVLNSPQRLLDGLEMVRAPEEEGRYVEPKAGWTLIFLGAVLMIFSVAVALDYII